MRPLSRRQFLASTAATAGFAAFATDIQIVHGAGGRVLRARIDRDLEILDPAYMIGGQEMAIQYAIFPRLVELDLSGDGVTWKPTEFVKRVEMVDDKTIKFELKSGLKWSNGFGEVTAEDVKYSFERMLDSDWKKRWDALDTVEVTGPLSGTIHLKYAYGPLLTATMATGVGAIMCKEAVEKLETKQFTLTIPAACGPYMIKEHTLKQKMVLAPNPDWIGAKPAFDEIQCVVIESGNAAELAFEAGELEITRIDSKSIPRYREKPVADSDILIAGNLQYAWVGMNTEHEKLKDIRVRKAIQRAVDVDKIQKIAFKGVAERSYGIVPPGVSGRREAAKYAYDLEEAQALMKEAGVTDLSLNLVTINKVRERLLAAQIIQSDLKKIGIEVKILPLDSGQFWGHGREKKGEAWKESQLWIMRFGGNVDPADYFQWFIRSQIGNWNWERWADEEFDKLYNDALAETDLAKRTDMYLRMQEIMEDTGAYVWLNHEPEAFLYKKTIQPAVDPTGVYLFPPMNVA